MPTKLEAFVGFMNNGSESQFFKRFTLHMTLSQLNALLTELESTVTFPDQIPKAVAVVGRNKTAEGNNVWALDKNIFIDENGSMVRAEDHGLRWISHLVAKDITNALACKERSATVHLPLTKDNFDLMCHFLKGSIKTAVQEENLAATWGAVLEEVGIDEENPAMSEERPNVNFLPTFFTASTSIIMAHYDKVCAFISHVTLINIHIPPL